jgi:hypothetical protein
MTRRIPRSSRCSWAALAGSSLLGCAALLCPVQPLLEQPATAAEAPSTSTTSSKEKPRSGREQYTSLISEVDACNRAQQLRPDGSTVTSMRYWRGQKDGESNVTCRISWSTATDALPTERPILFGPSSR